MGDLERLRTFVAVTRAGSVTDGARRLGVSQPAATHGLQALESVAGRQLLRRLRRGVELTPAGTELMDAIAPSLDAVEEGWSRWLGRPTDDDPDAALRGVTVYLGGPSEYLVQRVLPALAPLVARGLQLRMRVGDDALVLGALVAGELDLAVLTTALDRVDVATWPLERERFMLVASPAVARRIGTVEAGPAGAERLRDVPLLSYAEGLPLVGPWWHEVFRSAAPRAPAVVVDSLPALARLAEDGVGITVLPEHVAGAAVTAGRLVPLCEPPEPPGADLYLAHRRGARRSEAIAMVEASVRAIGDAAAEAR